MPWYKPSPTMLSRGRKNETRYSTKDKDGFYFPIYSRNSVDFAALFGPPPPYRMYPHPAGLSPAQRPVEQPRESAYCQPQAPAIVQMATAPLMSQHVQLHVQPPAPPQKMLPQAPLLPPPMPTAAPVVTPKATSQPLRVENRPPQMQYRRAVPLPKPQQAPAPAPLHVVRRRNSSLESVVSPTSSPRRTLSRRHSLTAAPSLYSAQDTVPSIVVLPPMPGGGRAVRFNENPVYSPKMRRVDTWSREKTPRRGCLKQRHTL
ncbi:hypothetical protein BKA62DRAFT_771789 [Auriculariales sp. MPI-PUGE-AT-0066]|nr:hypothetical protein BKA62DRAFT_771789 [Auriculariales sp. MPI-PUGE-AT-0066]